MDSNGWPHISYIDYANSRLMYAFYDGSDWNKFNLAPAFRDRGTSIAIDHNDNIHIAYFEEDPRALKYASYDGSDWNIVTVDANGRGACSIAVDSAGNPHVSYYTSSNTYYAHWNGTDWILSLVDGVQGVVTSIAIDDEDGVHISYSSYGAGLNYAYWNGTSFHTQYLGEISTEIYYHSLATDSLLRPHIAYLNKSGILNYTYKTIVSGTDWNKTSVISDKFSEGVSLDLDDDGAAHILCRNFSIGYLQYINNQDSSWSIEIVNSDLISDAIDAASIEVDSTGRPHISYRDNNHLWHAVYGSYWAPVFTNAPDDGRAGYVYEYTPTFNENVSILAQSTNAPFLTWESDAYQGTPSFTQYGEYWINITALSTAGGLTSYQNETFHIDTRWVKDNVTRMYALGGIGFGSVISMVLDSSGNPHIAYSMGSENQLRYAYWNGISWVDDLVDDNGEAGGSPSMVLDEDDRPIIAYRNKTDSTTYEVKLAEWTGSGWEISTLFSGQNAGSSISTAIWGDRLSVSYNVNGDIRVDTRIGTDWSSSLLGQWGAYVSLQIDYSGGYHLAYHTYSEVVYAYRSDGGWSKTIVDSKDNYFGTAISMALDSSGNPHLSYHDSSDPYGLRYAFHDGIGWSTETVDNRGISGDYTSLSLDAQDRPHIMYYNPGAAYSNLNYAYHDGTSWQMEVVDGLNSNMGAFCGLALDSSDVPHVAYYGEQELWYATVEMRGPAFQNQPVDGYQDTFYSYRPEFNEMASVDSYETNAPFLNWNATSLAYEGTPTSEQTGTYWINISATAVYGGLSAYQNGTFSIKPYYAPTITPLEGESPHNGQVESAYSYRINANESVVWSFHSDAAFLNVEVNHSLSFKLNGTPTVAGTYYVNISATSITGALTAYENFTLTISPKWAPTITSDAVIGAQELVPYSYVATANETVTWQALQTNAPFLAFSTDNHTVYGTPSQSQAGTYYVNVSALSDAGKLIGYQNYTLVVGSAWAPTITSDPGAVSVQATTDWSYIPTANESVTWGYTTNAGDFLTYDAGENNFTLCPQTHQLGTYYLNISATSAAGGDTAYQNLTITVTGVWHPDWDSVGNWNGEELQPYLVVFTANETVTWSHHNDLPSSLTVSTNGTSLNISGTPQQGDAGEYYINITAVSVEGKLERNWNYTFTITAVWAPTFISVPGETAQVTYEYVYLVLLNESASFNLDTDAPFLGMDDVEQNISGTPGVGQHGTYYVNISATSINGGLTSYQNYTLTVLPLWGPAFGPAPVDGQELDFYNHTITANETIQVWFWHYNFPSSMTYSHNDTAFRVYGTPEAGEAGTYYLNLTGWSADGKESTTHNWTFTIGPSWGPSLGDPLPNGQVTVFYNHTVTANESLMGLVTYMVLPDSLDVDVDFLNGTIRVYGTPQVGDEGIYKINVTAYSLEGKGETFEEWYFVIIPIWEPTFLSGVPSAPAGSFVPGQEFIYTVLMNESCTFTLDSNASFLSIDSNGTISGTLVAGTYYVNVSATSVDGLQTSHFNFTITTVDKVLLQGVVTDSNGNPLAGVSVVWNGTVIATTDANGTYAVLLDEGDYVVEFEKDGYVVATLNFQAQVGTPVLSEVIMGTEAAELDLMIIGAVAALMVIGLMAAVVYLRRP